MERLGKGLFQGDDQDGNNILFVKVAKYSDGSAMDDSKVDGEIYIKVAYEYFRRVESGDLAWVGIKSTSQNVTGLWKHNKLLIGAEEYVAGENVAVKADVVNHGNNVTRAGQFYSTQQGSQSFTGIDVQTTAENELDVDHVATNQNFTRLRNSGVIDKAYGLFHVGVKQTEEGIINNAYGYYHAGWSDGVGGKFGKKWSFYAAADYMFLSAASGIAINTFEPKEIIDIENGDVPGLGAKFCNAFVGNWFSDGAFASFGHHALKGIGTSIAILQSATGETFVNAAALKSIFFTIGIENKGRISPGGKWQLGDVNAATLDTGEVLQVEGKAKVNTFKISNCPVFADNAAAIAGGLIAGDVYRTAADLKIVI